MIRLLPTIAMLSILIFGAALAFTSYHVNEPVFCRSSLEDC